VVADRAAVACSVRSRSSADAWSWIWAVVAATPDKPWRLQQLLHSHQIDEGRQKGVRSTNDRAMEGQNGPIVVQHRTLIQLDCGSNMAIQSSGTCDEGVAVPGEDDRQSRSSIYGQRRLGKKDGSRTSSCGKFQLRGWQCATCQDLFLWRPRIAPTRRKIWGCPKKKVKTVF
jgi:hypothetical protein